MYNLARVLTIYNKSSTLVVCILCILSMHTTRVASISTSYETKVTLTPVMTIIGPFFGQEPKQHEIVCTSLSHPDVKL